MWDKSKRRNNAHTQIWVTNKCTCTSRNEKRTNKQTNKYANADQRGKKVSRPLKAELHLTDKTADRQKSSKIV